MVHILDVRSDGSYIVWSSRGVLNLDNWEEVCEEVRLDNSLTPSGKVERKGKEIKSVLSTY